MQMVSWEPCFTVSDVEAAQDHYARLGFTLDRYDEGYGFAIWGDLTIHLMLNGWHDHPAPSVVYLHVDDADALAAQWREAGAAVVGPDSTDYGLREGVHVDPDGNVLRFGSPIPTAP